MTLFVYDPTASDELSKVRGIGRYLQILKENLPKDTIFTPNINRVERNSVFLNPFINLLQPPVVKERIARKQVGIIHDVIPLQFSSHFPTGLKGKWNIWRNKNSLKNYDTIITDSKVSKTHIMDILKVPESKIKVVYPQLPKIFMSNESRIKNQGKKSSFMTPDSPFFIYVGDVTWNKNLVNIARAVQKANVTCVFVGKTFLSEIEEGNSWKKDFNAFKKLTHNDKRFVFSGFVSDEELVKLYNNAVANILVSHEEGYGFSYHEAASQKTPSILSDIEIFHEISKETALFVKPEDVDGIAETMKKLLTDNSLRNSLGQIAFSHSQSLSQSSAQLKDLLA